MQDFLITYPFLCSTAVSGSGAVKKGFTPPGVLPIAIGAVVLACCVTMVGGGDVLVGELFVIVSSLKLSGSVPSPDEMLSLKNLF